MVRIEQRCHCDDGLLKQKVVQVGVCVWSENEFVVVLCRAHLLVNQIVFSGNTPKFLERKCLASWLPCMYSHRNKQMSTSTGAWNIEDESTSAFLRPFILLLLRLYS